MGGKMKKVNRLFIPALFFILKSTTFMMPVSGEEHETLDSLKLRPVENTTEIIISGPEEIGEMKLWVPEGVLSDTGGCSVYPVPKTWIQKQGEFSHTVEEAGLFGPGNVNRVDDQTIECAGIQFPIDSPVKWKTTVKATGGEVEFTIHLTNAGDRTIKKAMAAICLKFLNADWWVDENVYVVSEGKVRNLAELGRDAGLPNGFQAYLLKDVSFDHIFYREFWGFNRHRLDKPVMVSEHPDAGLCVVISAEKGYFLHSNKGNPCSDVALAFGDLSPGETNESTGRISIRKIAGIQDRDRILAVP